MQKLDVRRIRKLGERERYNELYYHWREAQHMMVSDFPEVRRYGRRLQRKVEGLYAEWFAASNRNAYAANAAGLG